MLLMQPCGQTSKETRFSYYMSLPNGEREKGISGTEFEKPSNGEPIFCWDKKKPAQYKGWN